MIQRLLFDVLPKNEWDAVYAIEWTDAVQTRRTFDFENGGPLRNHSREDLARFQTAFGRWLGYLRHVGLQTTDGFAMLQEPTALGGFIDQLAYVAPCTARGYITDLRTAVRTARPYGDFDRLDSACRYFWRTAKPTKDKASLLVPARSLFDYGFELMSRASRRNTGLQRATQFRDGLMIAVLIASVVRLKNFASTTIDDHLSRAAGRYHLHFRAKEVKSKLPLEIPLPIELTNPIDEWLEEYRSEFLRRRGRWYHPHDARHLWISESGAPYRSGTQIGARIVRLTSQRFNKDITAHIFRDIAATSIAIEQSEQVGIIKPVLGHTDIRTGERFYNQASSFSAGLAFLHAVGRLRPANAHVEEL